MTFSPSSATRMIATPVGASTSLDLEPDSGRAEPGERLARPFAIAADATHHADVRVEPGRSDRLVRPLAARHPFERGAAQCLPGSRERSTLVTRSRLIDPTTVRAQAASARRSTDARSRFSRRSNSPAQSDERSGTDVDARHVCETLQRAHEDGELEVRLRDACRIRGDAGALQAPAPTRAARLHRARRTRSGLRRGRIRARADSGRADGRAPQRGLGAIGRMTQRCVACAGRRRIGVAARPALEQAAERECRGLARAELADEPARRHPLRRVILEDVGPAGLSGAIVDMTRPLPLPEGSSACGGFCHRPVVRAHHGDAPV